MLWILKAFTLFASTISCTVQLVVRFKTIFFIYLTGGVVDSITYSELRSKLAGTIDIVNDDHKPILITRKGGKPAVLMSLDDFHSYVETVYLLSSAVNVERLNASIGEIENGNSIAYEAVEE